MTNGEIKIQSDRYFGIANILGGIAIAAMIIVDLLIYSGYLI